ncbi:MAG TPA: hypothetical protein VEK73_18840, partial [Xanthobacteraceae bacterium]|nr:hypothetical protein [Xanthobacteraceae bacterium]
MRAETSPGPCQDAADVTVLPSPIAPWKGAPLRVIFAAEKPLEGEVSLTAPDGSVAATSRERHGGPPYFWYVEAASPNPGTWHVTLARDRAPAECGKITRDIAVRAAKPPPPGTTPGSIWPVRNAWNRAMENLYAAWIEKMFDDPLSAEPSWPALHEVLRDRSRNFLFNYLGLGEDEMKMVIRPDCADLPYFLRAYFSFKLGLPYGYSKCTRGGGGKPPHCPQWFNIRNPEPPPVPPEQQTVPPGAAAPTTPAPAPAPKHLGLVGSFGAYLQTVGDAVHSGSARTVASDNATDYYPVPLTHETLRPGTIYADPYGHVLTIVRFLPQSENAAGLILAVDGQPDGTVARKRYWRGNFLFAQDPALGSPGFKRFRPIVPGKNGGLRRLNNDEIAKDAQYGDFSLDQSRLGVEDFYDRMDDVMSPSPLDPVRAEKEAITSLEEQVKIRVNSVENGRKFQNSGHGEATMPEGAAIFETTGAWEDFSTPARDLRLLIALDVVRGFPDRVARRPERYAMPAGKTVADVKAELQSVLAAELAARKFSYTRSDGSMWTLALKDVTGREDALEMAYNPNDCVELRWGAPDNSDEASTCKRHAPSAQRT